MAGVRSKPQPSGKYRAWYIDADGRQRWFIGTLNRVETRKMAEVIEADHKKVRLGVKPAPQSWEKHRTLPVAEAVSAYLSWGKARGGLNGGPWGKEHLRHRRARLAWWIKRLGLSTLADVDDVSSKVEGAVNEMLSAEWSGKTAKNYHETLSAFFAWLEARGYLKGNPLKGLGQFDTTPRTQRRALTQDEIDRLITSVPVERRLLYAAAIYTGLRAGELRALCFRHLDVVRRGLSVEGRFAKNRKPAFQPLPSWLLDELAAYAEGKDVEARMFNISHNTARRLKMDALAAGIRLSTPQGVLCFHSLRYTFISLLDAAGVSVKQGMVLARHSTPVLTFGKYAQTPADGLAAVVEGLPVGAESAQKQAYSKHKQAVGAEGLVLSGGGVSKLRAKGAGDVRGFESPLRHQDNAKNRKDLRKTATPCGSFCSFQYIFRPHFYQPDMLIIYGRH